jgi:exodeoxyribonuclease VII large subunit
VLAIASQRFDLAAGRLGAALARNTAVHDRDLVRISARLTPGLLSRPYQLKAERLADQSRRLSAALIRNAEIHGRDLSRISARFGPSLLDRPQRLLAERLSDRVRRLDVAIQRLRGEATRRARLPELGARLNQAVHVRIRRDGERIASLGQMLETLNPMRPLAPGLARVFAADGSLVKGAADLSAGDAVRLVFADGDRGAVVTGPASGGSKPAKPAKAKTAAEQGDLF